MSKINFVVCWSDFHSKTWSGTPYAIYTALQKRAEISLHNAGLVAKNAWTKKLKYVINQINSGMNSLDHGEKILNTDDSIAADAPCIMFSEYHSKHIARSYCYQDLSVDFVLRANRADKKHDWIYKLYLSRLKKKKPRAARFYADCAGIFTMSEWLRKDMIENMGISAEKVHCVGGGCNVDVSKIDHTHKEGNKFLFIGRDWKRKNGDLVVEAFLKVAQECPDCNAQLYIAGPSKCPTSVKGHDNIRFLADVSYEELCNHYNNCDYFVMPSEFEAYGLVFGEALCFGLPCIGKNCYAMPEFIQDGKNGYLIQESNSAELAQKMKLLLQNGQEMAKRVQAEKDVYLAAYSWDRVGDRMIAALERDGYCF